MQQQFTKIAQLLLAIVAVATIASLATAVVMLSRSDDAAGSSSATEGALGAQPGDAVAPSDRGQLKQRANVILDARGERGRIKGAVLLDMFVNDQGKVTVQTRGGVDGLPRGEYGLWLEPPEDFQEAGMQPRLLQTANARSTKGLDLNRGATQFPLSMTELPVTVTTLEGFTLSFRQVQDGPARFDDPALLSRTLSSRIAHYP